jgi:uncharacterized protein YecE (DUF72 family)
MTHAIRIGVGGWTYEPWRDNFYPSDLPQKRELEFASRKLTAIEINGTFYRNQKPETYAKWAAETPDGFVFSVKAQRFAMTRKTADEIKSAVDWFIDGGVRELGDRLGPINWQFQPTKKFDPDYFAAFFDALPPERDGRRLRHVIEVRHDSFNDPRFEDMLRAKNLACVFADEPDWPSPDRVTADFAYARLQASRADEPTGYPPSALDAWAATAKNWAKDRDVFVFFISGAKARDPSAALALIERLGR